MILIGVWSFETFAVGVDVKGFINATGSRSTTGRKYRGAISDTFEFGRDSSIGLNFKSIFNNHWSAELQVLSAWRFQEQGAVVDIALISWEPLEWLTLNFGRQHTRTWMHSEYRDVGVTYPWVTLPEEVYSNLPITSREGVEAVTKTEVFDGAFLTFGIAAAKLSEKIIADKETSVLSNGSYTTVQEKSVNLKGKVNLSAFLKLFYKSLEVRIAYAKSDNRTEVITQSDSTQLGNVVRSTVITELVLENVEFLSMGLRYHLFDWTLMSEFVQLTSNNDILADSDTYYISLGRNFWNDKFHGYGLFSKTTSKHSSLSPGKPASYSLGLNYLPNMQVVLKAQWKYVYSENGSGLFDGDLSEEGKANVYMFGVSSVF